jgi:hypothetical protein
MIGWIFRRLKWFGLLAAIAPFAVGALEYNSVNLDNDMRANGIDAVAEIEGGTRTKRRRTGSSFSVNLSWKDAAGQMRMAEKVSISRSLADRIIKDDQLVTDTIKIRYLPNEPGRKPVIAEAVGSGGDPLKAGATMAAYFVPTAVLGALLFVFLRRRERAAA